MSVVGFSLTEPENKRAKRNQQQQGSQTGSLTNSSSSASSVQSSATTSNTQLDPQAYGLTLYELHRKPRTPVTDESTTVIQIRNLNIELTCPVCLGILHNTMTIMECLHRFCSGCISKSLRLGKKECPTCRAKCPSMRYLRPDPNFEGLIAQIYPNLDEYEAKQESIIEEINKSVMQRKTLLQNVEQGKKRQALAKASRSKREYGDGMGKKSKSKKKAKLSTDSHAQPLQTSPKQTNGTQEEISFILLCHPNEKGLPQLANKYLRTSRQLTVLHLYKFLAKKLHQDDFKTFSVSVSGNLQQELSEEMTLEAIEKAAPPPPNEELTIYYKLKTT